MINFRFDISKVELEDSYAVIEYGVAENRERLYFIAPKEWVEDKYPEAEGSTIILEFNNYDDILEGKTRYESISPVEFADGDMIDYDWNDISLEHDEIMQLVDLAAKTLQERRGELPNWSDKYMERRNSNEKA